VPYAVLVTWKRWRVSDKSSDVFRGVVVERVLENSTFGMTRNFVLRSLFKQRKIWSVVSQ